LPDKAGGPLQPTETIECPLCSGAGALTRAEILDRLGVKDFARVAQLSAEEAFRLLQNKHDHEHQSAWARFETELAKRTAEITERHKDELRTAQSERDAITRRVEDCLREVAQLREKNQQLEAELSKVARIGKREEMDFAEEARTRLHCNAQIGPSDMPFFQEFFDHAIDSCHRHCDGSSMG
jgi:hypothetical protein